MNAVREAVACRETSLLPPPNRNRLLPISMTSLSGRSLPLPTLRRSRGRVGGGFGCGRGGEGVRLREGRGGGAGRDGSAVPHSLTPSPQGGEEKKRCRHFHSASPTSGPSGEGEGSRIAKVMARAGLCSRRDAEEWIAAGR